MGKVIKLDEFRKMQDQPETCALMTAIVSMHHWIRDNEDEWLELGREDMIERGHDLFGSLDPDLIDFLEDQYKKYCAEADGQKN